MILETKKLWAWKLWWIYCRFFLWHIQIFRLPIETCQYFDDFPIAFGRTWVGCGERFSTCQSLIKRLSPDSFVILGCLSGLCALFLFHPLLQALIVPCSHCLGLGHFGGYLLCGIHAWWRVHSHVSLKFHPPSRSWSNLTCAHILPDGETPVPVAGFVHQHLRVKKTLGDLINNPLYNYINPLLGIIITSSWILLEITMSQPLQWDGMGALLSQRWNVSQAQAYTAKALRVVGARNAKREMRTQKCLSILNATLMLWRHWIPSKNWPNCFLGKVLSFFWYQVCNFSTHHLWFGFFLDGLFKATLFHVCFFECSFFRGFCKGKVKGFVLQVQVFLNRVLWSYVNFVNFVYLSDNSSFSGHRIAGHGSVAVIT